MEMLSYYIPGKLRLASLCSLHMMEKRKNGIGMYLRKLKKIKLKLIEKKELKLKLKKKKERKQKKIKTNDKKSSSSMIWKPFLMMISRVLLNLIALFISLVCVKISLNQKLIQIIFPHLRSVVLFSPEKNVWVKWSKISVKSTLPTSSKRFYVALIVVPLMTISFSNMFLKIPSSEIVSKPALLENLFLVFKLAPTLDVGIYVNSLLLEILKPLLKASIASLKNMTIHKWALHLKMQKLHIKTKINGIFS